MTLQRRTPLRAKPRSKGNRGELAVIDLLKAKGWKHARRNWQSGGQGGGDIIEGPVGVHLEVKHHETCRIWDWLRQAEGEARPTDIPVVVCRRNHMQWQAVMPADEFDALLELRPRLITATVLRLGNGRCQLWEWVAAAAALSGEGFKDVRNVVPVVRFSRPDGPVYVAAPAGVVFDLIAERELA